MRPRQQKRRWFDWHSLLGQTSGMMLFLICWSGSVAVFSHEIDWLLDRSLRADTAVDALDWQGVMDAARTAHPDAAVQWIEAPHAAGFAATVVVEVASDVWHRIYVDPVTLAVTGESSYLNVQRFFRSFHMALFQADYFPIAGIPVGYFIVLLFALPLAGLTVTTLVFYKRWWRSLFKLDMGKGPRVLWSDLHKLAGVWSIPFIAVIVITSLWYLAEWYLPYPNDEPATYAPATASLSPPTVNEAVALALLALPGLDVRGVYLPASGNTILLVQGHDGGTLTRGRAQVRIDLSSGQVVGSQPSASLDLIARLRETVDVLHFGTWSGTASKILYLLFGLTTASLAFSGTWISSMRRARGGVARNRETLIAIAITGSSLGIGCAAAWKEISGYGIDGAAPVVAPGAIVFILSWVAITAMLLSVMAFKVVKVAPALGLKATAPEGTRAGNSTSATR